MSTTCKGMTAARPATVASPAVPLALAAIHDWYGDQLDGPLARASLSGVIASYLEIDQPRLPRATRMSAGHSAQLSFVSLPLHHRP